MLNPDRMVDDIELYMREVFPETLRKRNEAEALRKHQRLFGEPPLKRRKN